LALDARRGCTGTTGPGWGGFMSALRAFDFLCHGHPHLTVGANVVGLLPQACTGEARDTHSPEANATHG